MPLAFEMVDDDGFADVTIGTVSKKVDIWKVWGEVDGLRAQARANPEVDLLQLTVEYLDGMGFPGVSQKGANTFLKWHAEIVNAEGKAEPGVSKPDSPGSTAPESSTSPPE